MLRHKWIASQHCSIPPLIRALRDTGGAVILAFLTELEIFNVIEPLCKDAYNSSVHAQNLWLDVVSGLHLLGLEKHSEYGFRRDLLTEQLITGKTRTSRPIALRLLTDATTQRKVCRGKEGCELCNVPAGEFAPMKRTNETDDLHSRKQLSGMAKSTSTASTALSSSPGDSSSPDSRFAPAAFTECPCGCDPVAPAPAIPFIHPRKCSAALLHCVVKSISSLCSPRPRGRLFCNVQVKTELSDISSSDESAEDVLDLSPASRDASSDVQRSSAKVSASHLSKRTIPSPLYEVFRPNFRNNAVTSFQRSAERHRPWSRATIGAAPVLNAALTFSPQPQAASYADLCNMKEDDVMKLDLGVPFEVRRAVPVSFEGRWAVLWRTKFRAGASFLRRLRENYVPPVLSLKIQNKGGMVLAETRIPLTLENVRTLMTETTDSFRSDLFVGTIDLLDNRSETGYNTCCQLRGAVQQKQQRDKCCHSEQIDNVINDGLPIHFGSSPAVEIAGSAFVTPFCPAFDCSGRGAARATPEYISVNSNTTILSESRCTLPKASNTTTPEATSSYNLASSTDIAIAGQDSGRLQSHLADEILRIQQHLAENKKALQRWKVSLDKILEESNEAATYMQHLEQLQHAAGGQFSLAHSGVSSTFGPKGFIEADVLRLLKTLESSVEDRETQLLSALKRTRSVFQRLFLTPFEQHDIDLCRESNSHGIPRVTTLGQLCAETEREINSADSQESLTEPHYNILQGKFELPHKSLDYVKNRVTAQTGCPCKTAAMLLAQKSYSGKDDATSKLFTSLGRRCLVEPLQLSIGFINCPNPAIMGLANATFDFAYIWPLGPKDDLQSLQGADALKETSFAKLKSDGWPPGAIVPKKGFLFGILNDCIEFVTK